MAAPPPPPPEDGLVYIAYAEREDDVAFELCDDIEEALGVYQIMKEDGFTPRIYQATEIEVAIEE
jgi:pentatricopeptide repeat protein